MEDASKNLDSIEKDQRSQSNPVMSSRRTKQTSQKNDNKITDELSKGKCTKISPSGEEWIKKRMNSSNKVDKNAVEPKVIIKKEKVSLINHDLKVKNDSVIELTGKKTTVDITVEKVSLEILGQRVDNKAATAVLAVLLIQL